MVFSGTYSTTTCTSISMCSTQPIQVPEELLERLSGRLQDLNALAALWGAPNKLSLETVIEGLIRYYLQETGEWVKEEASKTSKD